MDRLRTWLGWLRSGRLSRTSQCSTSRTGRMARSRDPTLSSIRSVHYTCPQGKLLVQFRQDAEIRRHQGWDAALSREQVRLSGMHPEAALLPQYAASQGSTRPRRGCARLCSNTRQHACLRTVATSAQENRDALRPSQTHPQGWSASAWTRRGERRVPARRHRSEFTKAGQASIDADGLRLARRRGRPLARYQSQGLRTICQKIGLNQRDRARTTPKSRSLSN